MALTKSYERVDDAFKDKTLAPYSVGSTALVVLLSACQIIVANCGDSRALLCRGSQAIPLTADHKVQLEFLIYPAFVLQKFYSRPQFII